MDNQDSKCSSPAVTLAFLGGGRGWSGGRSPSRPEVGGRDTSGFERVYQEGRGRSLEKAKEARAALDETTERGKHFIAEKAADVEAAAKAGRETMKEKMDKCCS